MSPARPCERNRIFRGLPRDRTAIENRYFAGTGVPGPGALNSNAGRHAPALTGRHNRIARNGLRYIGSEDSAGKRTEPDDEIDGPRTILPRNYTTSCGLFRPAASQPTQARNRLAGWQAAVLAHGRTGAASGSGIVPPALPQGGEQSGTDGSRLARTKNPVGKRRRSLQVQRPCRHAAQPRNPETE